MQLAVLFVQECLLTVKAWLVEQSVLIPCPTILQDKGTQRGIDRGANNRCSDLRCFSRSPSLRKAANLPRVSGAGVRGFSAKRSQEVLLSSWTLQEAMSHSESRIRIRLSASLLALMPLLYLGTLAPDSQKLSRKLLSSLVLLSLSLLDSAPRPPPPPPPPPLSPTQSYGRSRLRFWSA